ncbi:hypothetical protein BDV96DRAFT_499061 [Lophiotrema nucula]|uniref:Uncharacterized protein n=1 Tax=Lophiotrema nucula TaxID=690887 RepID=A0A6A5YYB8_9PLEO|nr:hypothetical protein BDV96DRAFT_499061 [Lophiotrema nucula]
MERTPSPPRRVRTPPAPLHGVKFDSYEPYSPRRTTRSTAREQQTQLSPTRARHSRVGRASTPTSTKRKNAARISNQGLSPPSSPASPYKQRSSPRSTRRAHLEVGPVDSDSDHQVAPTPSKRFLSAMDPRGSLPTPAKTPRKRVLQSQEELSSTARVLFQPRPATLEDAMPTPRKYRKSKKEAYSLESFALQADEEDEKIPIYTDSKERVPEVDAAEDNPFLTKKGKGKAKANGTSKSRKTDAKTTKMEEAVNRDEGIVFQFRGKKIFRKFTEGAPSDAPDFSGDEAVLRQAGHEAHRPLTRSSIKPRKLFQEEIEQRNRELGHDDDEEAVTDIEVPVATPSRRKIGLIVQEATPPPTNRVKRPEISFEGWSRVKRGSTSGSGSKKRPGSPLEGASPPKQARSEPSSAMSIDEF